MRQSLLNRLSRLLKQAIALQPRRIAVAEALQGLARTFLLACLLAGWRATILRLMGPEALRHLVPYPGTAET